MGNLSGLCRAEHFTKELLPLIPEGTSCLIFLSVASLSKIEGYKDSKPQDKVIMASKAHVYWGVSERIDISSHKHHCKHPYVLDNVGLS